MPFGPALLFPFLPVNSSRYILNSYDMSLATSTRFHLIIIVLHWFITHSYRLEPASWVRYDVATYQCIQEPAGQTLDRHGHLKHCLPAHQPSSSRTGHITKLLLSPAIFNVFINVLILQFTTKVLNIGCRVIGLNVCILNVFTWCVLGSLADMTWKPCYLRGVTIVWEVLLFLCM